MNKLVIALTYYNAPLMLQEHINHWKRYPDELTDKVKVILIDDGSMIAPADHEVYKKEFKFPVEVYRITKDIPQNTFGARNLAFHLASVESAKWVLCLDIDHVLPSRGLDGFEELKPELSSKCYYRPTRYKKQINGMVEIGRHLDTFLISPDTYWKAGGYDEDLRGYYFNGAALHFRMALSKISRAVEVSKLQVLFYPTTIIPDASPLQNQPQRIFEGTIPKNKKPSVLNFEWERVI